MCEIKDEDIQKYIEGKLSDSDFELMLGPGCKAEHKWEKETRFPPNKPIEHWKRKCTRIYECDESWQNRDWFCRAWEFDY